MMADARTPRRVAAALSLALVAAAAACHDQPLLNCFESGAVSYGFSLPGDTGSVFRWPASRQPVRVYAEPVGALQANTDAALAAWNGAFRCGELSLARIADSSLADIIVRNPPVLPPAPKIELAADSVGACSGVMQPELDEASNDFTGPFRIYVSPNSFVSDTAAVAGCYRFTVTHEIGHAIGLFRHSNNPDDLMYVAPYRRFVTINDRFTAQFLYHREPTMAPPP